MIEKLRSNPKKLFLIDGIGGLITAFSIGIVLYNYSVLIGLPTQILTSLAILGLCYATYSILCVFFLPKNWQNYVKGIAIANLLYCIITLAILITYNNSISLLGILYFSLEIIIILLLAMLELKVQSNTKNHIDGKI